MHRTKLHVVPRSVTLRSCIDFKNAFATVGLTRLCTPSKAKNHMTCDMHATTTTTTDDEDDMRYHEQPCPMERGCRTSAPTNCNEKVLLQKVDKTHEERPQWQRLLKDRSLTQQLGTMQLNSSFRTDIYFITEASSSSSFRHIFSTLHSGNF